MSTMTLDRDHNAAINIMEAELGLLGDKIAVRPVLPQENGRSERMSHTWVSELQEERLDHPHCAGRLSSRRRTGCSSRSKASTPEGNCRRGYSHTMTAADASTWRSTWDIRSNAVKLAVLTATNETRHEAR